MTPTGNGYRFFVKYRRKAKSAPKQSTKTASTSIMPHGVPEVDMTEAAELTGSAAETDSFAGRLSLTGITTIWVSFAAVSFARVSFSFTGLGCLGPLGVLGCRGCPGSGAMSKKCVIISLYILECYGLLGEIIAGELEQKSREETDGVAEQAVDER